MHSGPLAWASYRSRTSAFVSPFRLASRLKSRRRTTCLPVIGAFVPEQDLRLRLAVVRGRRLRSAAQLDLVPIGIHDDRVPSVLGQHSPAQLANLD